MIKLGDYNKMTVVKEVDFGLYLDGGNEGEILLPKRYVPEGTKPGDELEVFVYLDQEERPVATTEHPLCKVGDFAYLEVSWVNEYGAFLNWGLMKDLFCPFREQKQRMVKGRSYIVHVHLDEESFRIVASAKVEHYLSSLRVIEEGTAYEVDESGAPLLVDDQPITLKVGDKVDALIWQKTDLGFKAIINNRYAALLYDSQVFRDLHTGDRVEAYISKIRPDGKIDIALQQAGRQHTEDFAEYLLRYLQYRGGRCRLGDKSSAEEIREQFQVSKKTYKRAIGDLYKRRLIIITDDGIELVD